MGGERACPPEDCGSVSGYYKLVRVKKNKKHQGYSELIVKWLGEGHDFELFDVEKVNKKLRKLSRTMAKKDRCVGNKREDGFWADGYFAETIGSNELEEKRKTFHKKHDEDMNFNCRKCGTRISAHNKDWHDGMCDDCFNKQYFPGE